MLRARVREREKKENQKPSQKRSFLYNFILTKVY
jgi:hypothetical protein